MSTATNARYLVFVQVMACYAREDGTSISSVVTNFLSFGKLWAERGKQGGGVRLDTSQTRTNEKLMNEFSCEVSAIMDKFSSFV